MPPARPEALATSPSSWLLGPLLFLIAVSPAVTGFSAESLVVHHVAHWLMVVAGALIGYQLRDRVNLPGRAPAAWIGLGTALIWHFPPALAWSESSLQLHVLAHACLVASGVAFGWAAPKLTGTGKAFLFVTGNVVMWPIVLAELAGVFNYAHYPGQSAAAGVTELIVMSCAWLVLALWEPLRRKARRWPVLVTLQAAMVGLLVFDWMAR